MDVRLAFSYNPAPWTGGGTNTWLVTGPGPTLIDAGSGDPGHLEDLSRALEEHAGGQPLARVLVTHGHGDHAGGAAALADRWPSAAFAKYPWPERDGRYTVAWSYLKDGDLVDAGGEQLWVVHTPGHAPDHVCYFEPHTGTLFAGDLVRNGGTVVVPASHGGDLAEYLESLHRVLELRPRRILAGHGPAIDQPEALLRSYLSHRLARERQVVEALRLGPATVTEMVAAVYQGLAPELAAAAGENVLAHLRKLEREGRVRLDEGGNPLAAHWRLLTRD